MGLFDDAAIKQMLAEEDRKCWATIFKAAHPDPYPLMVDWLGAVVEFLKHRDGELCHDRRTELAKAFGLEDKFATTITFEDFCRGCITYQRGLFGKSDRETVYNALSNVLRDDLAGEELVEARKQFVAIFGQGMLDEILQLQRDRYTLKTVNRMHAAGENGGGSYWGWGDDGHDHPESLSCPVMVQPHVVRRWVAVEEMLRKVLDSGYLRASGTIHTEARELLDSKPAQPPVPNWAAIDNAIEVLNRALAVDPLAVHELFGANVPASQTLCDDPTIQVRQDGRVAVLGIINGLFGVAPSGYGYITADYRHPEHGGDEEIITKFRRTDPDLLAKK